MVAYFIFFLTLLATAVVGLSNNTAEIGSED
jgi:hypothetical protein